MKYVYLINDITSSSYVQLRTIGFSDAVFLFLSLIFPRRFRIAYVITTRDNSTCKQQQQQKHRQQSNYAVPSQ